ncbi:MAG: hypothetical protein QF692_04080 [Alphaproteobacteria bacterium]|jgi:hypothetical protein|nr:hypothetical protein [Alphaproteobacteria bacterium]MDP7222426.1 hypothetical protein [Alphaproteobacteria bacterium]
MGLNYKKISCSLFLSALLAIPSYTPASAESVISVSDDVLGDLTEDSVSEAIGELEKAIKGYEDPSSIEDVMEGSDSSSDDPFGTSSSQTKKKGTLSKNSGYYKKKNGFFGGIEKPKRVFNNID